MFFKILESEILKTLDIESQIRISWFQGDYLGLEDGVRMTIKSIKVLKSIISKLLCFAILDQIK